MNKLLSLLITSTFLISCSTSFKGKSRGVASSDVYELDERAILTLKKKITLSQSRFTINKTVDKDDLNPYQKSFFFHRKRHANKVFSHIFSSGSIKEYNGCTFDQHAPTIGDVTLKAGTKIEALFNSASHFHYQVNF